MVKPYFQAIRNKEQIEKMGKKYGFKHLESLDKFIMDYEVYGHVKEIIPDCVVKGGMAVSFHLQDPTLRRLSIDIDMVTDASREDVINKMKKVSAKIRDIIDIGEPHVPKKPKEKKLPLLTYYCKYKSSMGKESEIKMDIFHKNRMELKTKHVERGFEIMGFDMPIPISIYDRGTLIGDKLTTLPFNTIGINSERKIDVTKQIYDISALIKTTQGPFPMGEIIDAFEKISGDEMSYFAHDGPSFDEILDDIVKFPEGILQMQDSIKLDKSYEDRFRMFTTELLGNTGYPKHSHMADILLVRFIIELIVKRIASNVKLDTLADRAAQVIKKLNTISKLGPKDNTAERKKIIAKYGRGSTSKIIKEAFAESAFLYGQLLEAKKL